MVVYCVGDVLEKRRFFRAKNESGEVSVDNEDVLHTFALGGTTYCVIGENPFSDMSVGDYVAYSRSLTSNLPIRAHAVRRLLKICGYRGTLEKRVGKINRIALRSVLLAAKVDAETKTLYVNFDGLKYTRKHKKDMSALIKKLSKRYDLFFSVSDMRFVPIKSNVQIFRNDKIENETSSGDKTWGAIRARAESRATNLFTVKGITVCK